MCKIQTILSSFIVLIIWAIPILGCSKDSNEVLLIFRKESAKIRREFLKLADSEIAVINKTVMERYQQDCIIHFYTGESWQIDMPATEAHAEITEVMYMQAKSHKITEIFESEQAMKKQEFHDNIKRIRYELEGELAKILEEGLDQFTQAEILFEQIVIFRAECKNQLANFRTNLEKIASEYNIIQRDEYIKHIKAKLDELVEKYGKTRVDQEKAQTVISANSERIRSMGWNTLAWLVLAPGNPHIFLEIFVNTDTLNRMREQHLGSGKEEMMELANFDKSKNLNEMKKQSSKRFQQRARLSN